MTANTGMGDASAVAAGISPAAIPPPLLESKQRVTDPSSPRTNVSTASRKALRYEERFAMERRHFLLGAFGAMAAANVASARTGVSAGAAADSAAGVADARMLLAQAGAPVAVPTPAAAALA